MFLFFMVLRCYIVKPFLYKYKKDSYLLFYRPLVQIFHKLHKGGEGGRGVDKSGKDVKIGAVFGGDVVGDHFSHQQGHF